MLRAMADMAGVTTHLLHVFPLLPNPEEGDSRFIGSVANFLTVGFH